MGEPKIREVTEQEFVRSAAGLGLSAESCARMIRAAETRHSDVARAIQARQAHVARRSSVELIREDRDRQ